MQDPMQISRVARFETFELNLKTGELRKGGVKIRLQEQSFQILAALLERPGELVAREALHERLWPDDTFVDFEKGLNIAVSKLRQALSDSPDEPRFVETLPRRGYRFIGVVERIDESGEIIGLPTGAAAERTISHYRLLEKIGEGGMGVVYKALDTNLNRTVALKFLATHLTEDPKARERFRREAQAAAAVDHPNICTVYEIDEVDGQIFIAMAYVEGQSLDKKIAVGPLPLDEALDIATQTAQGLQAAHEKGVVHRDIKSSNLMLTPQGQVKILDFGLARLADQPHLTQTATVVGTPSCMSPEQAQRQPTDRRTDVWSLGVVIYEMVTGRLPFEGDREEAVLYAIVHETPQPLTALRTGIPIELDHIAQKAMAKDAANRYQHVDEMIVDVRGTSRELESGESITPRQETEESAPPRQQYAASAANVVEQQRLRRYQALSAMTAVVVFILGWLLFRAGSPEAPKAPLRRFDITPPVLPALGIADDSKVAISPNGRYVAFVADDDDGKVWVQDLEQLEPRALDGTEGARAVFWSPGSDFIGFGTGRELKSVPVQGGPAIRLCELSKQVVLIGTWSPDGEVIVFSAIQPSGLYQVPALGGTPELLILPSESDESSKEPAEGNLWPHFLPREAGARVLVSGTSSSWPTLMVHDLENGRHERLGSGASPFYSPTGHLVYRADAITNELWALPFSLEILRAVGDPFPIVQNGRDASVSSDGTLVYLGNSGSTEQQLVWRDRQGKKAGEIGPVWEETNMPALSPDGRHLAFTAREGTNVDIRILNLDRAVMTRLTSDPGVEWRSIWSPKGEQLAFRANWAGNVDIFLQRTDGVGDARALVPTPLNEYVTDWSPNGKYLFYTQEHPKTGDDIWYLERSEDGTDWEARRFRRTSFNETAAKFSRDGKFVAYVSDQSGRFEVYVQSFPEVGRSLPVSAGGGRQPLWSRDGSELFYVEGNTLMTVPVSTHSGFSTGTPTPLFELQNPPRLLTLQYDVSADGQRFVVVEPAGEAPQPVIRVVQNWFEEFRERE